MEADTDPSGAENSEPQASSEGAEPPSFVGALSPDLQASLLELGTALDRDVWFLIQGNPVPGSPAQVQSMSHVVLQQFQRLLAESPRDRRVAFVIDSPGGDGYVAYKLARTLRRIRGDFDVVVPRYAKSAATLFALGAQTLRMGADAELGPLDAQLYAREREEWSSALDEVQALDRLSAIALEQADQAMLLLMGRTGMKQERLIPLALQYAAEFTRPLMEKIDTVHFTQQSRILTVAKDYAERLLTPYYSRDQIQDITEKLVNGYNEHGFAIDREEVSEFLSVVPNEDVISPIVDNIGVILSTQPTIAFGRLENDSEVADSRAEAGGN